MMKSLFSCFWPEQLELRVRVSDELRKQLLDKVHRNTNAQLRLVLLCYFYAVLFLVLSDLFYYVGPSYS